MLSGIRRSLLVRVVLTLAAAGLLPLAITGFQLRANRNALLLQVQRTHMVAAITAAERVEAYLSPLLSLASSTAAHPALLQSPRSPEAQELLAGYLQAQPRVAAVGIFSPAGERVVLVQRRELGEEIAGLLAPADPEELAVSGGKTRPWVRIREALPEELGYLILVAEAEPLSEMVQSREIGEQAELVLASRERDILAGGDLTLEDFPGEVVEQALTGKLGAGVRKYEGDPRIEDLVVAHAAVEGAPWLVLSRQPARIAELAAQRMRRATWFAALGALLLTAVLSGGAYTTVIRPLRRLVEAQSRLAGVSPEGGSEIEQLESAFELLQQRIRDSEDLGKVFLGRYQVTELVGAGAMGSVFRGWDPKLRRPVALKTIRMEAEEVDREKLLANLLDEAAISARFNHPNIVTVYDVADQGQAGFIAMEFVDGVSLDAYLWRLGTLSPDEVIALGAGMARGLAAAHQHQLVHHDVKPANVLLGFDGSIKVTDFGISQLITSAIKTQDVICGTPGYLAPECLVGEGYTPASDLFSLGLILYEALTGQNPFFGRNVRETMLNTIMAKVEPLEKTVPGIPPELAGLVHRLLSKEPADRPADATTVAATLDRMVIERELVWEPDIEILKELKPRPGATRTQLFSLTEASGGPTERATVRVS